MTDRLVILAGGLSSRMKEPATNGRPLAGGVQDEEIGQSKSLIGVGERHRPFLDYLLLNARSAGYQDIVIVTCEEDSAFRNHYGRRDRGNDFCGLSISYATQTIPEGREKPLGTADALLTALLSRPDWRDQKLTVCNSDNLYSHGALHLVANTPHDNAMIDYDRAGLKFAEQRVRAFAVTQKDAQGFILDIIEKPSAGELSKAAREHGYIGVSMNLFCFTYDLILPFLSRVPLHPVRLEKELPAAVVLMTKTQPSSVFAMPLREHVPDLTNQEDIETVQQYLLATWNADSSHET